MIGNRLGRQDFWFARNSAWGYGSSGVEASRRRKSRTRRFGRLVIRFPQEDMR